MPVSAMQFRASSPYDLHRPSKCALRVALRHRKVPEAPQSPFDELLARLGVRHEKAHLTLLAGALDLSGLDQATRERETLAAIQAGAPAIYQARFRTAIDLDGEPLRASSGTTATSPFVQRSPQERTRPHLYIDRYGDHDGTATRLFGRLLDLLNVVRR